MRLLIYTWSYYSVIPTPRRRAHRSRPQRSPIVIDSPCRAVPAFRPKPRPRRPGGAGGLLGLRPTLFLHVDLRSSWTFLAPATEAPKKGKGHFPDPLASTSPQRFRVPGTGHSLPPVRLGRLIETDQLYEITVRVDGVGIPHEATPLLLVMLPGLERERYWSSCIISRYPGAKLLVSVSPMRCSPAMFSSPIHFRASSGSLGPTSMSMTPVALRLPLALCRRTSRCAPTKPAAALVVKGHLTNQSIVLIDRFMSLYIRPSVRTLANHRYRAAERQMSSCPPVDFYEGAIGSERRNAAYSSIAWYPSIARRSRPFSAVIRRVSSGSSRPGWPQHH